MNKIKKTETILSVSLIACIVIIGAMSYQMYLYQIKIQFLETSLAQKTLHYEWLQEITDSLINGYGEELQNKFEEIAELMKNQPNLFIMR